MSVPDLPEVASIAVAKVRPSDVIVVESEVKIDHIGKQRLTEVLQSVWPDNKILVVECGLKFKIARHEDVPPEEA